MRAASITRLSIVESAPAHAAAAGRSAGSERLLRVNARGQCFSYPERQNQQDLEQGVIVLTKAETVVMAILVAVLVAGICTMFFL